MFVLIAPPPITNMPFRQLNDATYIHTTCKGRLGSRGGGRVVQAKEDTNQLTNLYHFAKFNGRFNCKSTVYIKNRNHSSMS